MARRRFQVPFRRTEGCIFWGLGFRQSSYSPYRSDLAALRSLYLDTATASMACSCPRVSFRIQVSHRSRNVPPNSSQLSWEYNKALRGAGSFPSPVTVMAGTTALGLSRGLRTRPIRNRPRTPRWGQGRTQPGATPSTYVEPPSRAHSQRATSCRNNGHRPHQGLANARPLHPLPTPIAEPDDIARLRVRRRDRLGGILHEYEHAA
jgi:hypothetical protein